MSHKNFSAYSLWRFTRKRQPAQPRYSSGLTLVWGAPFDAVPQTGQHLRGRRRKPRFLLKRRVNAVLVTFSVLSFAAGELPEPGSDALALLAKSLYYRPTLRAAHTYIGASSYCCHVCPT